ncbi:MAG TPA: hypothetical protein VFP84_03150 [Kofleriaceae bacterium]|nr:hypothetical protein [Kofleriaceae bacterium]
MLRVLSFVSLAVLAVLRAPTAHAAPGLTWRAPATCPDDAAIRTRIERRLGGPLERVVHGIAVDITAGRAGFVAHIDLRGLTLDNDVRVLTSPSCDELTDAIAVVIARIARDAQPVRERAPLAMAPIALGAEAADAPLPTWGGGVSMIGLSGIGATPRVGFGGELGAYVRHEQLFTELSAAQWLVSTRALAPQGPGRVGGALREAALRVGWVPERLPLRLWAGGELGMIDGKGQMLGNDELGSTTWVSAVAGIGVAWPMSPRARLIGMFEVAVPFERETVKLEDGGEAFRPDVLAARYGVGLELGWP